MTVHLTINGKEIEAEEGKTILEAARENEIYIPTLCYHSHLHPIGSCRLCVVDIEGYPMPMASCTTPVAEGIKVHTNTGRVQKMRREAMELILVNHPLDCPVCDKGGECRLQDLAYEFGINEQPFHAKKPERELVPFSTPLIHQWRDRCVLCLRCVHVCHELVGSAAIDIRETGYDTVVYPVAPERCYSCGECLSVCPVGALTEAVSPVRGRVWQIERKQTTCGQCGVGCQMEISTYDNRPINVKSDGVAELAPNYGSLCVRGRFFYDYVVSERRLTQPKAKKGDEWISISWDEAYEDAINHLRETTETHGPESIGMIVSSRLMNDDLRTLYSFAKQGLGTPHVDASYRLDLSPQLAVLKALKGASVPCDSLDNLVSSGVVLVVGGDVDLNAQVVADRIRVAQRLHDTKVVVVNSFKTRLDEIADAALTCNVGTEIPVFYGLIKEALSENPEFQKAEGWQNLSKQIEDYASDAVCEAARIDSALFKIAVDLLKEKDRVSFVVGSGLGRAAQGSQTVMALANLARACEAVGKTVQWIPLTAYANAWGSIMVDAAVKGAENGLTYGEMIQAIHDEKIKALIVVEEDPVSFLPDSAYVVEALKKLDFLMVVDLFESKTAKLAHLLLPSSSFMEKSGAFINMEGKQRDVTKLIEPVEGARPAGQIFMDISKKMKLDLESNKGNTSDLVSAWREESEEAFSGFFDVNYQPPRVEGNSHLFLIPADFLYNHHYGTTEVFASAIEKLGKEPEYLMNPKDAARMGIEEGTSVTISTSGDELSITPVLTDEVKEGHLVLKGHYHDTGIQRLFSFELDEISKTPLTGVVRVKLQKP